MFKLLKIETLKLISYQDLRKREDTGCEVGRLLVVQERMSDLQGKCRRGKKENVVRSMTSSLLQGKSGVRGLKSKKRFWNRREQGLSPHFPGHRLGFQVLSEEQPQGCIPGGRLQWLREAPSRKESQFFYPTNTKFRSTLNTLAISVFIL